MRRQETRYYIQAIAPRGSWYDFLHRGERYITEARSNLVYLRRNQGSLKRKFRLIRRMVIETVLDE